MKEYLKIPSPHIEILLQDPPISNLDLIVNGQRIKAGGDTGARKTLMATDYMWSLDARHLVNNSGSIDCKIEIEQFTTSYQVRVALELGNELLLGIFVDGKRNVFMVKDRLEKLRSIHCPVVRAMLCVLSRLKKDKVQNRDFESSLGEN